MIGIFYVVVVLSSYVKVSQMLTYQYPKKWIYFKNKGYMVVYNTKPYPIETVATNPNCRLYNLKKRQSNISFVFYLLFI